MPHRALPGEGPRGAPRHRRRGARHGPLRVLLRPGAARHQAGACLLDGEPDRLHVRGPGLRTLGRRHVPPPDPRHLQGAALSRRRRRDPCPRRGAGPGPDGWPAAGSAGCLRHLHGGPSGPGGDLSPVGVREQGRHPLGGLRALRDALLACRLRRSPHDGPLLGKALLGLPGQAALRGAPPPPRSTHRDAPGHPGRLSPCLRGSRACRCSRRTPSLRGSWACPPPRLLPTPPRTPSRWP